MRSRVSAWRGQAEASIEVLIKAFDRENVWKMRDEMLGFRRRFRIFSHTPSAEYLPHMKATVEIVPDYIAFMEAEDAKFSSAEVLMAHRLRQALQGMIRLSGLDNSPLQADALN
jgi:hypothetical protein